MTRRNRKQKKRRTRKKRGGVLTLKQTRQCKNAGIQEWPPQKCKKYLQDLKNPPVAATTQLLVPRSKVQIKPGKEDIVLQRLCVKYIQSNKTSNESGSNDKKKQKTIKDEKVHPKNVNPQPSNSKCKKTCHQSKASGKCTKKPACDSIPGCLLVEKPTTTRGGKPGTPIPICTNWAGKGDMKILAPSHTGGGRRTRSRRGKGAQPKGAQPKCPPGLYWDAVAKKCSPPDDVYGIDNNGNKVGGKRRRRRRKSRRKLKRKSRRKSKHKRR